MEESDVGNASGSLLITELSLFLKHFTVVKRHILVIYKIQ